MSRFEFKPRYERKTTIDMTALIDLVFLLVVFFMVSSSLGKVSSISVNLPFAEKSGENVISNSVITVSEKNEVYVNDVLLNSENLLTEFEARKAELSKGTLLIRGDKKSDYETIIKVMDSLNKVGLSNFTLSTVKNK